MTLPTAVTLAGLFSAVLAAGDGPVAYTINSTEYYTVAPGANARRTYNNEIITKIIRARRSDGSTASYYVHVPTDSTDLAWDEVTIIDVTARKFVEAALFLNAKSTFVLTERGLQDQLNPGADPAKYCLQGPSGQPALDGMSLAGRDTILGLPMFVLVSQSSSSLQRSWYSPSLGCVLIQSEMTEYTGGKPRQTNLTKPDHIVIGEPDPALFSPPGDELKPSDVYQRRRVKFGTQKAAIPVPEQKAIQKADDRYRASHP